MQLQIQVDETTVANTERALGDMSRRAPQAISGAINETTAEAKTSLIKRVLSILNIPRKSVASRIKQIKATPQKLAGEVRLSHEKRPGLFGFGAKETKKGVSFKLTKTGGRKTVAHAFIAAKRGQSHLNVFIRKMVGGKRWDKEIAKKRRAAGLTSWPLHRLMGLSPWAAIAYPPGVLDAEFANAQEAFHKNTQQRIDGILGGHIGERRRAA